jgi:Gametolysin peptidase M11
VCLIDLVGILYDRGDDENNDVAQSTELRADELFLCRLQDDIYKSRAGYRIELPWNFAHPNHDELATAEAMVCISNGHVDRDSYKIIIEEGAKISLLPKGRRAQSDMAPVVGKRTILAVQLTTTYLLDGQTKEEHPGMTKSEIEGSIFGTGLNAPGHDLVSQYRACSFGALDLRPAVGNGIQNGVVQVVMRKPVAGGEILGSLQDDILEAAEEQIGSLEQFDHIIFCIPDEALMDGADKWTAFTYFHSHWSFFQRQRCSAMSVTIHELGHNLGFRHSAFGSEPYGDESGYEGFTVYQTGAPVKCFNGHKNWISGWFQDRQILVDPTLESSRLLRLVTFVDYDKPMHTNDVVLIRVGSHFIQYNRAKGINIDTGMNADTVTITYAKDAASDSQAVAGLTAGQTTRVIDFKGTGYDLVIEVCEFGSTGENSVISMARQAIFGQGTETSSADYAWVSIYLDDGLQKSKCDRVDQATSEAPSVSPTSLPTTRPPENLSQQSSTTSVQTPWPNGTELTRNWLEEQERLQKRPRVITVKDVDKLVKDESDKLHRRRRLKGGH